MIIGIDPGTTGMGYALLDAATDPATIVDCGLVPVSAEAEPAGSISLLELRDLVRGLAEQSSQAEQSSKDVGPSD